MSEIRTLTDATWQSEIDNQPALILLSNDDGLRGDFSTAFKKAVAENQDFIFAKINSQENPEVAELFRVNSKPVLIGWYKGKEFVRKPRPWGSDVVLTIDVLKQAVAEDTPPESEETEMTELQNVDNAPVKVTDATFQQEVVDYELPVLVDFWAEWCGPCRMVAPVLDKLAQEYAGKIRIAKVNTDENPGLSQTFRIMSIPTIMVFKEGHLVFNQPGAFPEPAFRELIEKVIELEIPQEEQPT